MVYGSLNIIAFLLFLKGNGVLSQCNGRAEFVQPSYGTVSSTSYTQPVGQVCFPAVIQVPDPEPPAPQKDDDDYLKLIYLLVSAITGSNKENSGPQPQQPQTSCNCDCYDNGRSSRGYVCDECARSKCPYKNFFGALPSSRLNSDIQSLNGQSKNGCMYLPYPVPVPVPNTGQSGNNYCDPCYEYEDYPSPYVPQINLVIKTECAD